MDVGGIWKLGNKHKDCEKLSLAAQPNAATFHTVCVVLYALGSGRHQPSRVKAHLHPGETINLEQELLKSGCCYQLCSVSAKKICCRMMQGVVTVG